MLGSKLVSSHVTFIFWLIVAWRRRLVYKGPSDGFNPRIVGTWYSFVKVVSKRLASLRNIFMSLDMRVVLLNSFLNSFMKMPISAMNNLVMMQRRFI